MLMVKKHTKNNNNKQLVRKRSKHFVLSGMYKGAEIVLITYRVEMFFKCFIFNHLLKF